MILHYVRPRLSASLRLPFPNGFHLVTVIPGNDDGRRRATSASRCREPLSRPFPKALANEISLPWTNGRCNSARARAIKNKDPRPSLLKGLGGGGDFVIHLTNFRRSTVQRDESSGRTPRAKGGLMRGEPGCEGGSEVNSLDIKR